MVTTSCFFFAFVMGFVIAFTLFLTGCYC
jgi:hypothetical protein